MQSATATFYTGTSNEHILVTGSTETGRQITMVIPAEIAKELLTVAAQAYAVCGHIGHAIWHVENNTDFENCSSCQRKI